MTKLPELIEYLSTLLDPGRFRDYGPNGLQVPPASPDRAIGHVVTGVSAHLELFEKAAALRADLVLTHHGLFWDKAPRALDRPLRAKLALLLEADIALAAYHLPLDAHATLGNNALLAAGLGARRTGPFAEAIGTVAVFDEPISRDELSTRVATLTGREPLVFPAGPDTVTSIGLVSGGGSGYLDEAIGLGLDAFLTGEPTERVMAVARESGITYIAAGHHATETFGVRALGDELAARFGVRHTFVDVPNPI